MGKTKIEWTQKTWNPVTGCTKVSQGCKFCYAETIYERFNGKGSFRNVLCHDDRLLQPLQWKIAKMCFVNSMSDLFHEDVPFTFIDRVFAIMAMCEGITFQVLTKRPEMMLQYFNDPERKLNVYRECRSFGFHHPKYNDRAIQGATRSVRDWPLKNVWLGVSVEDDRAAHERIPILLQVPAAKRFLSCEPLLGPVDLEHIVLSGTFKDITYNVLTGIPYSWGLKNDMPEHAMKEKIDWVIVGGESGLNSRPMHPNWARQIRDACYDANVPFFFKQWGNMYPVREHAEVSIYPGKHPANPALNPVEYKRMAKSQSGKLLDGVLYQQFPY